MTRQETINKAISWALDVAKDQRFGYDQSYRWGPDYDCSSFIITAWEQAGVPVKTNGATYTGNMAPVFQACGFRDVTGSVNRASGAGLQPGDVLLNVAHHTEMYVGDGKNVKASINEKGTTTGGQTGDQSGHEIYVGPYYLPTYGWDMVLRYMGGDDPQPEPEPEAKTCQIKVKVLRRGAKGDAVKDLQALLIQHGYYCGGPVYNYHEVPDGDFGDMTEKAVIYFQELYSVPISGIADADTWEALNNR